jgi:hypothetical protein
MLFAIQGEDSIVTLADDVAVVAIDYEAVVVINENI